MWNLPAPPGFRGLDPEKPVMIYERMMPHWRQDGATYFATMRLGDSLPQSKLRELRAFRAEWERKHPPPRENGILEELAEEVFVRVERWLDQGMGTCQLKDPESAGFVTTAMHHFDEGRYELGAYVVMPNHVHVVLRPTSPAEHPLEKILGSWKQFAATRIHQDAETTGHLWQQESFDRIIRDEEHLYRVLQYIGRNPKNAGLSIAQCPRWIRPEWVQAGWRFEDL